MCTEHSREVQQMTTKHPIDVSITIGCPPSEVWDYVRNIESHVDWMHDANAIRITSLRSSGVGTVFECDTKIGPFRLVDKMEITTWKENEPWACERSSV